MVTVDLERCPRCDKAVYEAESAFADGVRFHRRCFKCQTCDKKLDSTTAGVHAGAPYCKGCHKKVTPNEAPKVYADTAIIAPKNPDEKGCPRCGGMVFEAEKITVKDDVYHKKCFSCHRCMRLLDSLTVEVGPTNNIYCRVCFKVVTAAERPTVPTDTTVLMAEDDKDGCPRCGGRVFEAEKMTAKTGNYHKKCFTCATCKRALDYQLCAEGPDGDIYCKLCYAYKHGHKAKPNLNVADVAAIPGDSGEMDVCPRCGGRVFEAEKQVAKGSFYHKKCFTCNNCKHQLDASNFANGPDNEVYCLYCYRTTFGHKAPTRSMPLDTTSIEGQLGDIRRCPRCHGKVFEAEKMVAASGWYHRHCFRCSLCNQPVDSTSVCDGPDDKIYCRVCYGRIRGRSKPRFLDGAAIETWKIQGNEEESAITCPKCNGKVFDAEKMSSSRHAYHKKCFTCRECERMMDAFIACDTPDGDIACRNCYEKKYSCKAPYNELSGADMLKLLDTSIIQAAADDEKDRCPRCGGKVFHAERILGGDGKVYHKKCAHCAICEKPLNSMTLCNGKDGDIYCKSCYARKFGAPGYRGAGCGDWTDADSAETLRPVQGIDVAKIKGTEGDPDTCPRCKGKIFETERQSSRKANWHKKCFTCFKCRQPLDPNLQKTVDAPDGEIYCKACFKKAFPSAETPLIYSDTGAIRPGGDDGGCPRCGGAVFQAEEVNINNRVYHKKCLTCANCRRSLDMAILAIGPDDDIYCKVCCHKISWPGRFAGSSDTAVIPGDDGEPTSCPRCNGKVFEAEKMITKRGWYHKKCFACCKCKTQLDYFNCIEGPDDDIYCKVCYLRFWGPGGKNKFGEKSIYETDDSDPDACFRCHGKVFEQERVNTKYGPIHKYCLSCNECKTNLDASNFVSGMDGEVYCKHCYAVKFGHKQKSDYKAWMDVQAIPGDSGEKDTCPRCSGKVFEAEKMVTRIGNYHRNCFSCIECKKKLDSVTCCEGPDYEIYCKSCYSFQFGTKARSMPKKGMRNIRSTSVPKMFMNSADDMLARSTVETWVIKAEKGEQDCCPKCDGRVFEAEKMVTASGAWYHRNCFRCEDCNRLLDSLTNNDGPDGKLYCKKCYNKKYGPQTRSSDIDHKMLDLSVIKSSDEKKNCPRCGGQVFKAEEIASGGRSYHKKCATCFACEKQLTFNTVCDGDDREIYCKSCYGRKFAPAGFRGAGASGWVDQESSNVLRHSYQAF